MYTKRFLSLAFLFLIFRSGIVFAEVDSLFKEQLKKWDEKSIYLKQSLWSGWKIVKGGQEFPLGTFYSGLLSHVSDDSFAYEEAKLCRNTRIASMLFMIGSVGAIAALPLLHNVDIPGLPEGSTPWICLGGSFICIIIGGAMETKAHNHLHKSIWLYNRGLLHQ
jgi:hypothetical protein